MSTENPCRRTRAFRCYHLCDTRRHTDYACTHAHLYSSRLTRTPQWSHRFFVSNRSPFKLHPGMYRAVFVDISGKTSRLLSVSQELQRDEGSLPQMSVSYGCMCKVAWGVSATWSCLMAVAYRKGKMHYSVAHNLHLCRPGGRLCAHSVCCSQSQTQWIYSTYTVYTV